MEYYLPGSIKKKQEYLTKTSFGGTLKRENGTWRFTTAYTKPISYKYKPKNWFGSDLNATTDYWIVFANPTERIEFVKQQDIIDIEEKIHDVTKQINDRKNVFGRKRRYLNNKRKKLHKQYDRLMPQIIDMLLDKIKEREYGIVIDNARTATNTFGQDKIIPEMIRRCEEEGIPFYVGNPAYTSRTCLSCNHTNDERGDKDIFTCDKCGFSMNSHVMSALNCLNFAKQQSDFIW